MGQKIFLEMTNSNFVKDVKWYIIVVRNAKKSIGNVIIQNNVIFYLHVYLLINKDN